MLWDVGEELGRGLPVDIYVDFDGTIAPGEPTDRLFDRFADASWRSIDQAWLEGRLTSWQATAQTVSLLRATPRFSAASRSIRIFPPSTSCAGAPARA